MWSLLVLLASLSIVIQCDSTSLIYQNNINTKSKVALSPVQITCSLNDVIVLATPVVSATEVLYRLHRPNGEVTKTDFSGPKPKIFRFYNTNSLQDDEYKPNKLIVKYITKNIKAVYPKLMYKIINIDQSSDKRDDTMMIEENRMNENDFMVGPLLEEDHGEWVLVIYCKDIDGKWIEMFQVITITVITFVQMVKPKLMLREGSTLNLRFKYPIKELETCELEGPSESPVRYFDGSRIELDKCGYVITNITQQDHGTWRVTGVGKMLYKGTVMLYVVDENTPEDDLLGYYEYKNSDNTDYKAMEEMKWL